MTSLMRIRSVSSVMSLALSAEMEETKKTESFATNVPLPIHSSGVTKDSALQLSKGVLMGATSTRSEGVKAVQLVV